MKNGQYAENGDENGAANNSYSSSESSLKAPTNPLRMPGHTPVIFNEGGNRPVLRITIEDAKKELEDSLLQESVPDWVKEILIYKNTPNPNKISFLLSCYSPGGLKATKKDRLSANDIIQVKKIIEHISNKESKLE